MKRLLVLFLTLAAISMAADQVPFLATFTSSAPGGTPPTCPADHPMAISLVGEGVATHMGIFKDVQSHCVSVIPDANGLLQFINGQATLTAANGDELRGTYSGYMVITGPTTAEIHGLFITNGGTGRFSGATGVGSATGTLNLVNGTSNDLMIKGTISRPKP